MECPNCHKILHEHNFLRKGKLHKTCNECSDKRLKHKDERPFKKCPKCHKKYFNIIKTEKPFQLKDNPNLLCGKHQKNTLDYQYLIGWRVVTCRP